MGPNAVSLTFNKRKKKNKTTSCISSRENIYWHLCARVCAYTNTNSWHICERKNKNEIQTSSIAAAAAVAATTWFFCYSCVRLFRWSFFSLRTFRVCVCVSVSLCVHYMGAFLVHMCVRLSYENHKNTSYSATPKNCKI